MNYNYRDKAVQGAFDTFERANKRNKVREFEGGLTRSTKNGLDISQIVLDDATCLQVTTEDVGGGISSDDVGKFWFLTDYSRTDLGADGDVLRP